MTAHVTQAGRLRGAPFTGQRHPYPQAMHSPGGEPDAWLVAESLRTPERFAAIYDRYFAEIYRYVASRLGPDPADDLAAETFIDAFRRRAVFDAERGAVRPWLYGIATNLVARHRRAEARRFSALARAVADRHPDDQEDRVTARVSAERWREPLARALAGLRDGDRDVLLLVSVSDLSYDEVATALSIPLGTVGSRLNRARRKVREALRDIDPSLDSPIG